MEYVSKKKYKIAFMLFGFYESGLSLASALTNAGHSVDVYCVVSRTNADNAGFGFEFKTGRRLPGKIYEIDYNQSRGTSFASEVGPSHVYIMQGFLTGVSQTGIIKWTLENISKRILHHNVKTLNRRGYDFVDIVSMDIFSRHLYPMVKVPNIHSFHEIADVFSRNNDQLDYLVRLSIERNDNIRLFSQYLTDKLICQIPQYADKVYNVPFGLFTNYLDYGNIEMPELEGESNYVLYVGLIAPYKGIGVMYDAVKLLSPELRDKRIVVAGKGNAPIVNKMKADKDFLVINRLLSNDELICLIRKCRFVVCPYLAASQSGIPQIAYLFNKPIVASRTGAFVDTVIDNKTGILVEPNSSNELSVAISSMITDEELYRNMCDNIANYDSLNPQFDWKNIVEQYIAMIKKVRKEQ